MVQNDKSNTFKKLIDRLQEDSWQMELLISGFAIFGLFHALDPIIIEALRAQFEQNLTFVSVLFTVHFCIRILIFNLMVHVLMRGLWIGSLGMRYVFGDIDFDQLNYTVKFNNFLKRKVGTFDGFISKLENICSVLFAISFLLIFYVVSIFIILVLGMSLNADIPDWSVYLMQIVAVLFLIGTFLTFLDFITIGFLKKKKWLAKIYYPFYRVFSILTLSFLYRPLVYNLLDNKYGRRISMLLIPTYLAIYFLFQITYKSSNFITPETVGHSSSRVANMSNYIDEVQKNEKLFMGEFAIQSTVITEPFIRIIVPINKSIEDSLMTFDPGLKPRNDNRGLKLNFEITIAGAKTNHSVATEKYIKTFEKKFHFKIDTTLFETQFVVTSLESLETYIATKGLAEGKHTIEFLSMKNNKSKELVSIRKVPFWFYKE